MKKYGKVTEYNGLYGKIKSVDGIDYTLLDKNIVDKNIEVSDVVEFEPETFKTIESDMNMARFVNVLKKEK